MNYQLMCRYVRKISIPKEEEPFTKKKAHKDPAEEEAIQNKD